MKYMILLAALLSTQTSFAWECQELEAQFIGYVKSVKQGPNNTCEAKLTFPDDTSSYNENMMCPLSIDEVVAAKITVPCDTQVDDLLSGYLFQTVGESKVRWVQ